MASAAEGRGDGSHVRSVLARTHTVIAAAIAIVPHDAERMLRGEALADLTGQDRGLDRGHDGSLKVDQGGLRREFAHEFVFITEDGASLLFQIFLLEAAPELIIERMGGQGRADFTAGGEGPGPEVFVLDIVEEPGRRLIVRPFPGQDRSGLFHVEVGIGKAGQGLFCGDVVIEDEKGLRVSGDGVQYLAGIAEIYDDDSLALQSFRRGIPMFDGDESSRGKFIPDRPGCAESIGAFRVIEDDRGGGSEWVL